MIALHRMIDHTLLRADADEKAIDQLCDQALAYHFKSCCVNSCWVKHVHERLAGSDVSTCTVIGFPLGAMSGEAKLLECALALRDGADEIDMVAPVGLVKSGRWDLVEEEIRAIKQMMGARTLKVILECCLLQPSEIVQLCQCAVRAGADFVKTSTGFSTGGARVEDVRLMRETVGSQVGVKASGGIHSRAEALAMLEAGANRIGASAGPAIVEERDA